MNAAAATQAGQPQWMGLATFAFAGCTLRRFISDAHVAAASTFYVGIHTIELSEQEDGDAA
jgi:hypothetical protein